MGDSVQIGLCTNCAHNHKITKKVNAKMCKKKSENPYKTLNWRNMCEYIAAERRDIQPFEVQITY
jgi:hypothetical protein